MGRPKKATVDYFPHYCHHGKTLYILENLYGNDGYAFFYKLLEALGDSEGHYYDCRDATAWEFLQAKTRTDEITTCSILDKLANMGVIDPELWKIRVIWMETFTSSIKDVYLNRRVSIPKKPMVSEFLHVETTPSVVSTDENPQSKVKESKVKKNKEKSIGDKPPTTRFIPPTIEEVKAYCLERNNRVNPERFMAHYTSNGWKVGKNKMVDWKAAVITWENNEGGFNGTGNNGRAGTGQSGTQAGTGGGESRYPVDVCE